MDCFIDAHYHTRFDETLENGNDPLTVFDFEDIARHFAKWGAEHLRDSTMMDKSLEEAAEEIVIKMHPCLKDCTILGDRLTRGQLMALVKAGAEWQKSQMFKDAIEGRVFMSFAPGHNQMVMADVDLPTNTKVRIVVLKEEE